MKTMKRWLAGGCLLLVPLVGWTAETPDWYLKDGQTIVFIGDSNTFADQYIQDIDAFLFTRFPGKSFRLINRGLPSETIAGTSETTHQPPRPDVHTRFSRTVPPLHPDVLVACYGMNDGIYAAPNPKIFDRFKLGMQRLVRRTRDETKAALVLLTPPPFDPAPYQNRPPTDPPDWRRPVSNYDDTLAHFSNWLLSLREGGPAVVDLHTPIGDHLKARRETDPDFILAGDGVHLDSTGHFLMAQTLLLAWHAPALAAEAVIDIKSRRARTGDLSQLDIGSKGRLSCLWSVGLPWPVDPRCDFKSVALARTHERLNQFRLTVLGCPELRYDLVVGPKRLATVTREQLATGVNLMDYPGFPNLRQSQEVLKLVQQRRQILLEHWVRNDPHPRLAGMSKNSQASPEAADALEVRIRQLCQRQSLRVELQPIEE